MKVIGILLVIGGGLFALLALSEWVNYLDQASNPFSGLALNSAMYLTGIAATAILAGIGFVIAPGKLATPATPTV